MRCAFSFAVIGLFGCNEYSIGDKDPDLPPVGDSDVGYGICSFAWSPRTTDFTDGCGVYDVGGFTPWIEWEAAHGLNSWSTPAVADLDGDGRPEIVINVSSEFLNGKGKLWALSGDGSGVVWKVPDADLGYGSSPAVGDIDGDGDVEILAVRANGTQSPFPGNNQYALVAWDHEGTELWESANYGKNNFDYASGVSISDMDHDGSPEIVVGRVIFHADGTERGKGEHGHGSWGELPAPGGSATEASLSAVADVDLDGIEEVIVGNAMYSPDGETLWHDGTQHDGMIAIANLDDDPEAEWVVSSFDTVRAVDTDGHRIWGPTSLQNANIVSPAAIADIDGDGYAEVVVAGGNRIVAFNHDGSVLWFNDVRDSSGASGPSIFDFDGDGIEEVVYIDEIAMYAFNGTDGFRKFWSDRHASNTMMDYPVIADVDVDGSAEIVVMHAWGPGILDRPALTVYGAGDGRWAPTRSIWNQHAYAISHVEDDGTIPTTAVPHFTTHNSWHAATDSSLWDDEERYDLQAEIREVCEIQCELGKIFLAAQLINRTPDQAVPAGVPLTLYGLQAGRAIPLDTVLTTEETPAGHYGEQLVFEANADQVRTLNGFRLVADDDGTGLGLYPECEELDNADEVFGEYCQ